ARRPPAPGPPGTDDGAAARRRGARGRVPVRRARRALCFGRADPVGARDRDPARERRARRALRRAPGPRRGPAAHDARRAPPRGFRLARAAPRAALLDRALGHLDRVPGRARRVLPRRALRPPAPRRARGRALDARVPGAAHRRRADVRALRRDRVLVRGPDRLRARARRRGRPPLATPAAARALRPLLERPDPARPRRARSPRAGRLPRRPLRGARDAPGAGAAAHRRLPRDRERRGVDRARGGARARHAGAALPGARGGRARAARRGLRRRDGAPRAGGLMRRRWAARLATCAGLALALPARAIVVDGDAEAAQRPPASGGPFASVAKLGGTSGVYLGKGWALTAGH